VDFNSSSSSPSQQTVFNNLLNQLTQAINGGDLTNTATVYNALTSLSPSTVSGNSALGTFFSSLGTALNDGSASEAQAALSTYQSQVPASTASSTAPAASTGATAAQIASGLIMSQIQSNTVSTLLAAIGGTSSTTSSSNPQNYLMNILNAAYPPGGASSSSSSTGSTSDASGTSSADSTASPYDTLVSAIQSNLTAGTDPTSTALAYLSSAGNFVNTSA
jgi:hypothetical protein